MHSLDFFGAANGEVTGSNYLLTGSDGNQILIDFGMFQGPEEMVERNYDLLQFHPPSLKGVFLTHAHLDHSGRLPLLIYSGYQGKIYMTPPTKALLTIILSDSGRIAEKDMKRKPLYTSDEVWKVLNLIETVEYDEEISVGNFRIRFIDAGHILGSASIEIIDTSGNQHKKIVFSGDLGNTPQDIVKPTEYINSADYVVMESTYGDSAHPEENAKQIILEELNAIEKSQGVLLIPAFAIERTQEVLHIIHHLKLEGKVTADMPVYLDSPMGTDATYVYLNFREYLNDEIRNHSDFPFNFEGLTIIDDFKESQDIKNQPNPKVIIAGSGMMSGGRIMQHAIHYLPHTSTRLLFVGYQAEETIGREILNGAKNVVINKTQIPVRAHIREIKILSSHADQPRLLKWLKSINGVEKVFITHGEKAEREALAEKIKTELNIPEIYLPEYNQKYVLSNNP